MSAYPNSDLNPVLAAGNCKLSAISSGELPTMVISVQDFVNKSENTVLRRQTLSLIHQEEDEKFL